MFSTQISSNNLISYSTGNNNSDLERYIAIQKVLKDKFKKSLPNSIELKLRKFTAKHFLKEFKNKGFLTVLKGVFQSAKSLRYTTGARDFAKALDATLLNGVDKKIRQPIHDAIAISLEKYEGKSGNLGTASPTSQSGTLNSVHKQKTSEHLNDNNLFDDTKSDSSDHEEDVDQNFYPSISTDDWQQLNVNPLLSKQDRLAVNAQLHGMDVTNVNPLHQDTLRARPWESNNQVITSDNETWKYKEGVPLPRPRPPVRSQPENKG